MATLLANDLDITVPLKKPEVSCKIKVDSPTHFHLSQMRNFCHVAPTIAPVEGYRNELVLGSGRVTFPLVLRKVVERYGPNAFAPDDQSSGTGSCFARCGSGAHRTEATHVQVTRFIDSVQVTFE